MACCSSSSNLSSLHSVGMLSNLNDLRQHENLCDIRLQVQGCILSAHKVVLSACSPYFKVMFTQDMAEKNQSSVKFHGIDVVAMKMIIDFAYTGKLEVNASNVQNLVPAACLFQMHLITDECCQFLESQLHINNCIGIWRFADTYGMSDLTQVSYKFINQNFEEVRKHEEIRQLPIEDAVRILTSDDLNVSSEESVFKVMESWILHDIKNRKKHLPELLECIRIPLLSANYLRTCHELNKIIEEDTIAKKILQSSIQMLEQGNSISSNNTQIRPRCSPKALCAVGGKSGLFAAMSSLEVYFPQSKKWKTMASLPLPRYDCGAVVTDRKLYVIGGVVCEPWGRHSKSVAVWDSENNVWSKAVSMTKRRSRFGTIVLKGVIYVLGGYDGETYLKDVEKLSPRKQQWERVPDMIQTRSYFTAAAIHDRIYAIGGYGPTHHDSVEMFDTSTNQWQMVAPMLTKRINFGVTVLNNNLYVMGGHSGTEHLCSMEKYDPLKNEWSECDPMPRHRTGIGTAVIDNKLYVVGGHSGHFYLSKVDCYNPLGGTWHECEEMTTPRCNFGLAAL